MSESPKPTIGRIVHYGIGLDHEGKVKRRPAIVVEDWGTGMHPNLQVFVDGSNDAHRDVTPQPWHRPNAQEQTAGVMWRTSVNAGEGVGEWCWPPRA